MPIDDPTELEQLQVDGRDPHRLHPVGRDHGDRARQPRTTSASGRRAVALAAVAHRHHRRRLWRRSALIVKLDDIGLHLAERRSAATRALGNGLVHVVPKLLDALCRRSAPRRCCGSAAGSSSTGSRSCTSSTVIPHTIHDLAACGAASHRPLPGVVEWLVDALGGAIVGLIIGGIDRR